MWHPLKISWLLLPIMLYLLFVLPVYFDNNAGNGLWMPQNLLAWCAIALFVMLVAIHTAVIGRINTGGFMLLAVLAVVFMMLPWLWTPSPLWQCYALTRLAGLIGGLIFLLALCQIRITPTLRIVLLTVVVLSALIQAAEAMVQSWLPDLALRMMDFGSSSPYGIFQQRNLLASWLATGYGVALYLALNARTRLQLLCWVMTLYPLSAAVVLSQSRTGALGAVLMTILAVLSDVPRLRHRPLAVLRRVILISSLVAWCGAIGLWAMPSGQQADFQHSVSTDQRLRILAGTAEMIAKHPLKGSGLGSFESQFPRSLEDAGIQSIENNTFSHPHNEVMFVMAEGGIVALAGFLLLAGIWLWPLIRSVRKRDRKWLLPLTGLPIVVHMMTEYPLYLSTPHLILLLVLFRSGLPDAMLRTARVPAFLRITALPVTSLASGAALIILGAGFNIQQVLTQAEVDMNTGLIPSLPVADWRSLTQAERLDYDRHMLMANTAEFAHSPRAMADFTVWGKRWLSVHNNAEVSAAMIFIARRRGDIAEAEKLRTRAARVFVHDTRFIGEDR